MNVFGATLLTLALCAATCSGQTQSTANTRDDSHDGTAASASMQPKIDPAKEADIRKLLDVVGTKAAMTQMMGEMANTMRPAMTNMFPPGEYRDQLIELFFEKFQSKADPQQMVELAMPVYDKYLSDEDIRGLIQFYATPLGKRMITTLPKIMIECTQAGEKWGEQLGRESMQEVLAEHPDLKKVMEEASKNAQQR